jgi:transmembrane sensor
MNHDNRIRLNTQISEEAAEWFVGFRTADIDAAGRRAFDTWVRASPEHLRAFLEIAAIWNEGDCLDAHRTLDVEALVALARADRNIVPLDCDFIARDSVRKQEEQISGTVITEAIDSSQRSLSTIPGALARWVRSTRKGSIAASILIGLLGVGLTVYFRFHGEPSYATDVGEQRSIRLADGSMVELNSRSRVRVEFTATQRAIELLDGQALFQVAKDPARPFVVRSDMALVRAVGTQFDVNRRRNDTVVTVVEGRVAVQWNPETTAASAANNWALFSAAGAGRQLDATPSHKLDSRSERQRGGDSAVLLSAGEQLVAKAGEILQPTPTNVSAATAWTQRELVLESVSLAEVAEEFNRYSDRKLIVEDSGKSKLRLSGIFATDPDFLIRYLRERPDITIRETGTEIHIIRRAPQ